MLYHALWQYMVLALAPELSSGFPQCCIMQYMVLLLALAPALVQVSPMLYHAVNGISLGAGLSSGFPQCYIMQYMVLALAPAH